MYRKRKSKKKTNIKNKTIKRNKKKTNIKNKRIKEYIKKTKQKNKNNRSNKYRKKKNKYKNKFKNNMILRGGANESLEVEAEKSHVYFIFPRKQFKDLCSKLMTLDAYVYTEYIRPLYTLASEYNWGDIFTYDGEDLRISGIYSLVKDSAGKYTDHTVNNDAFNVMVLFANPDNHGLIIRSIKTDRNEIEIKLSFCDSNIYGGLLVTLTFQYRLRGHPKALGPYPFLILTKLDLTGVLEQLRNGYVFECKDSSIECDTTKGAVKRTVKKRGSEHHEVLCCRDKNWGDQWGCGGVDMRKFLSPIAATGGGVVGRLYGDTLGATAGAAAGAAAGLAAGSIFHNTTKALGKNAIYTEERVNATENGKEYCCKPL